MSKVGPKVARELPRHIPDSVGHGIGSTLGGRMGDGMRTGIAAPLRTMVGGLGTAFAAIGVANLFGSFISEAREAGEVTRITENAIRATGGAAGLTADQVGSLAEAISNKTGIDDEAVQSSANLLLCLEESAEALTRDRGWVTHDQLSVGDDILVYDPADDTSRWEPIADFYRYEVDTELIHWKSKQIDVKTTPHHRWWTVGQNNSARYTPQFQTTEQISGKQVRVKIGGGSPAGFAEFEELDNDLVELLGWIATEGFYRGYIDQTGRRRGGATRLCAVCGTAPARNRGGAARCDTCAGKPIQSGRTTPRVKTTAATSTAFTVGFSQSETANPLKVSRIRELAGRLRAKGHRVNEVRMTGYYNGSVMIQWTFSGDLARTVRSFLPEKKLTPALVTSLTTKQAELLLDTLIQGDGHVDSKGHRQYIQKDHGQLDVVAMLCSMLGVRTSVLNRGGDRDAVYLCDTNHLYGHRTPAERVRYSGVVWCPQVRTGIFWARNRGKTFLSGNTFKNVRDEVGAGNDVFSRATGLTQDLAAAGFGSADSAAKMLGKALNDPIAGLTALGRAGVTFSADQKEQIKTLVETGDVLGAQKIILDEVTAQVGGAAAAAADPMQKLGVIVGNLKERLGTALLPIITTVALWLSDHLPGAIATASSWFGRLADIVRPLFEWIGGEGVRGVQGLVAAFQGGGVTAAGFHGVMERIGVVARQVFDWIRGVGVPGLQALVTSFREGGVSSAGFVGVMERIGVVARTVFDFFRDTAIPALVTLTGWLNEHRGVLVGVIGAFVALTAITKIHAAVMAVQAVGGLVAYIAQTSIVQAVTKTWTAVQWLLNAALSANPIGIVVVALAALAAAAVIAYQRSETFRNVVQQAWQTIQTVVSSAWNNVLKPTFESFRHVVVDVLAPAVTWLWRTVIAPTFQNIGNTITAAWNTVIRPTFEALGNFIRDRVAPAFAAGVTAIGAAWDRVKEVAKAPVRFVVETVINRGIIDNFNRVAEFFQTKGIARLGLPAGFAGGGIFPGYTPGRDIGMIAVSGGEGILRPEATRAVGPDWIHSMNAAARRGGLAGVRELIHDEAAPFLGGFQAGGIVDRIVGGVRDFASVVWDFVSDPLGVLRGVVDRLLGGVGDSPFAGMLRAVPGKLVTVAADKIKELFGGAAISGTGGLAATQGLNPEFLRRFQGYAAAVLRELGIGPLRIISGFRTRAEQARLFAQKPGLAAPPGRSKHELGLAIDHSPHSTSAMRALARNFRLYYPMSYEPWHVQPFDRGGWLPPGLSTAYNGTGRPERVLGPGESGNTYVYNFPNYLGNRDELVREIDKLTRKGRI